MRLKNIKGALEFVESSKYLVKDAYKYKGKWKSVFRKKGRVELEIGVGKGDFLVSKAKDNPGVNYIGVEKYASVLMFAIKKANSLGLKNIKFILMDAKDINDVFYKDVDKLYLNFSDPWPKKRHEKRRLTSRVFLDKYDKIFKFIKVIEQKTDNDELYNFSVNSFKEKHYFIIKRSTDYDGPYKTEYEIKFRKKGKNINYIKVIKVI